GWASRDELGVARYLRRAGGDFGMAVDRGSEKRSHFGTAGDERGNRVGLRDSSLAGESVAWVAARNGLLCSVWMVAALCAYVRAVGRGGKPKRDWWWTSVALQVVALLTKPFAVSLPLVMLALDFFPLRRHGERSWWRLLGEKWLMIALSAMAAMGAVAAQEHLEGLVEYTFWARVLVAARG